MQVGVATVGTPGAITSSAIGTGTLTFAGGTLQAGGNYTIANAGALNTSGGTIDADGYSFTYAGAIANGNGTTGTLNIIDSSGGGTVILSGANTYSGATSLGDGTHAVTLLGGASDAFSANSPMTVNTNATLGLNGFNQVIGSLAGSGTVTNSASAGATLTAGGNNTSTTFSGVIKDGAGQTSLTKVGTGKLTLSNVNTYSGPTTVSAGTLFGGTPGAFSAASAFTIAAGATLDIGEYNQSIGSLAGAGTVQDGDSSTHTLTVGGKNSSTTFSGTLINGAAGLALTKTGSGTLTLTGSNTYSGQTIINGGTLEVDGSIADSVSVMVNAGGTLAGIGTVDPPPGGTTINNGGTLAPGNTSQPTGTLAIGGNLTFGSGALYLVQVTPSSVASTNVPGTASLSGMVSAALAPGSYQTKQYTILQSSGLGGTTFSGLTATGVPTNFTATLSYSADDVFLDLNAALGIGGSFNQNQQNVANAINGYFNGDAIPAGFSSLYALTGAALGNALTQLDGEVATGAQQSASQLSNGFLQAMLDPLINGNGYAPGTSGRGAAGGAMGFAPDEQASLPPDVALIYAATFDTPSEGPSDQRWSVWGTGYGGSGTTGGNATIGSHNLSAQTYGYAAGVDYRLSPSTVAGFALAGGGTSWGLTDSLGKGSSQALQVGGYGMSWFGPAYLAGAISFANNWFTTKRSALGDRLQANFTGQSYAARLEGGYRVPVYSTLSVTPYGAVQFQDFSTPGYSESDMSGGGYGLSYAAMNTTEVRTELGARFRDPTLLDGRPLILFGRLAWAHDFVSNPALNATFEALPGSSFTVYGAPIAHDSALPTLGAQYFISPSWSVIAKFEGEFAAGQKTYAGTGSLRYTWRAVRAIDLTGACLRPARWRAAAAHRRLLIGAQSRPKSRMPSPLLPTALRPAAPRSPPAAAAAHSA